MFSKPYLPYQSDPVISPDSLPPSDDEPKWYQKIKKKFSRSPKKAQQKYEADKDLEDDNQRIRSRSKGGQFYPGPADTCEIGINMDEWSDDTSSDGFSGSTKTSSDTEETRGNDQEDTYYQFITEKIKLFNCSNEEVDEMVQLAATKDIQGGKAKCRALIDMMSTVLNNKPFCFLDNSVIYGYTNDDTCKTSIFKNAFKMDKNTNYPGDINHNYLLGLVLWSWSSPEVVNVLTPLFFDNCLSSLGNCISEAIIEQHFLVKCDQINKATTPEDKVKFAKYAVKLSKLINGEFDCELKILDQDMKAIRTDIFKYYAFTLVKASEMISMEQSDAIAKFTGTEKYMRYLNPYRVTAKEGVNEQLLKLQRILNQTGINKGVTPKTILREIREMFKEEVLISPSGRTYHSTGIVSGISLCVELSETGNSKEKEIAKEVLNSINGLANDPSQAEILNEIRETALMVVNDLLKEYPTEPKLVISKTVLSFTSVSISEIWDVLTHLKGLIAEIIVLSSRDIKYESEGTKPRIIDVLPNEVKQTPEGESKLVIPQAIWFKKPDYISLEGESLTIVEVSLCTDNDNKLIYLKDLYSDLDEQLRTLGYSLDLHLLVYNREAFNLEFNEAPNFKHNETIKTCFAKLMNIADTSNDSMLSGITSSTAIRAKLKRSHVEPYVNNESLRKFMESSEFLKETCPLMLDSIEEVSAMTLEEIEAEVKDRCDAAYREIEDEVKNGSPIISDTDRAAILSGVLEEAGPQKTETAPFIDPLCQIPFPQKNLKYNSIYNLNLDELVNFNILHKFESECSSRRDFSRTPERTVMQSLYQQVAIKHGMIFYVTQDKSLFVFNTIDETNITWDNALSTIQKELPKCSEAFQESYKGIQLLHDQYHDRSYLNTTLIEIIDEVKPHIWYSQEKLKDMLLTKAFSEMISNPDQKVWFSSLEDISECKQLIEELEEIVDEPVNFCEYESISDDVIKAIQEKMKAMNQTSLPAEYIKILLIKMRQTKIGEYLEFVSEVGRLFLNGTDARRSAPLICSSNNYMSLVGANPIKTDEGYAYQFKLVSPTIQFKNLRIRSKTTDYVSNRFQMGVKLAAQYECAFAMMATLMLEYFSSSDTEFTLSPKNPNSTFCKDDVHALTLKSLFMVSYKQNTQEFVMNHRYATMTMASMFSFNEDLPKKIAIKPRGCLQSYFLLNLIEYIKLVPKDISKRMMRRGCEFISPLTLVRRKHFNYAVNEMYNCHAHGIELGSDNLTAQKLLDEVSEPLGKYREAKLKYKDDPNYQCLYGGSWKRAMCTKKLRKVMMWDIRWTCLLMAMSYYYVDKTNYKRVPDGLHKSILSLSNTKSILVKSPLKFPVKQAKKDVMISDAISIINKIKNRSKLHWLMRPSKQKKKDQTTIMDEICRSMNYDEEIKETLQGIYKRESKYNPDKTLEELLHPETKEGIGESISYIKRHKTNTDPDNDLSFDNPLFDLDLLITELQSDWLTDSKQSTEFMEKYKSFLNFSGNELIYLLDKYIEVCPVVSKTGKKISNEEMESLDVIDVINKTAKIKISDSLRQGSIKLINSDIPKIYTHKEIDYLFMCKVVRMCGTDILLKEDSTIFDQITNQLITRSLKSSNDERLEMISEFLFDLRKIKGSTYNIGIRKFNRLQQSGYPGWKTSKVLLEFASKIKGSTESKTVVETANDYQRDPKAILFKCAGKQQLGGHRGIYISNDDGKISVAVTEMYAENINKLVPSETMHSPKNKKMILEAQRQGHIEEGEENPKRFKENGDQSKWGTSFQVACLIAGLCIFMVLLGYSRTNINYHILVGMRMMIKRFHIPAACMIRFIRKKTANERGFIRRYYNREQKEDLSTTLSLSNEEVFGQMNQYSYEILAWAYTTGNTSFESPLGFVNGFYHKLSSLVGVLTRMMILFEGSRILEELHQIITNIQLAQSSDDVLVDRQFFKVIHIKTSNSISLVTIDPEKIKELILIQILFEMYLTKWTCQIMSEKTTFTTGYCEFNSIFIGRDYAQPVIKATASVARYKALCSSFELYQYLTSSCAAILMEGGNMTQCLLLCAIHHSRVDKFLKIKDKKYLLLPATMGGVVPLSLNTILDPGPQSREIIDIQVSMKLGIMNKSSLDIIHKSTIEETSTKHILKSSHAEHAMIPNRQFKMNYQLKGMFKEAIKTLQNTKEGMVKDRKFDLLNRLIRDLNPRTHKAEVYKALSSLNSQGILRGLSNPGLGKTYAIFKAGFKSAKICVKKELAERLKAAEEIVIPMKDDEWVGRTKLRSLITLLLKPQSIFSTNKMPKLIPPSDDLRRLSCMGSTDDVEEKKDLQNPEVKVFKRHVQTVPSYVNNLDKVEVSLLWMLDPNFMLENYPETMNTRSIHDDTIFLRVNYSKEINELKELLNKANPNGESDRLFKEKLELLISKLGLGHARYIPIAYYGTASSLTEMYESVWLKGYKICSANNISFVTSTISSPIDWSVLYEVGSVIGSLNTDSRRKLVRKLKQEPKFSKMLKLLTEMKSTIKSSILQSILDPENPVSWKQLSSISAKGVGKEGGISVLEAKSLSIREIRELGNVTTLIKANGFHRVYSTIKDPGLLEITLRRLVLYGLPLNCEVTPHYSVFINSLLSGEHTLKVDFQGSDLKVVEVGSGIRINVSTGPMLSKVPDQIEVSRHTVFPQTTYLKTGVKLDCVYTSINTPTLNEVFRSEKVAGGYRKSLGFLKFKTNLSQEAMQILLPAMASLEADDRGTTEERDYHQEVKECEEMLKKLMLISDPPTAISRAMTVVENKLALKEAYGNLLWSHTPTVITGELLDVSIIDEEPEVEESKDNDDKTPKGNLSDFIRYPLCIGLIDSTLRIEGETVCMRQRFCSLFNGRFLIIRFLSHEKSRKVSSLLKILCERSNVSLKNRMKLNLVETRKLEEKKSELIEFRMTKSVCPAFAYLFHKTRSIYVRELCCYIGDCWKVEEIYSIYIKPVRLNEMKTRYPELMEYWNTHSSDKTFTVQD